MYACPVKAGQGSNETTEENQIKKYLFGFPRLSRLSPRQYRICTVKNVRQPYNLGDLIFGFRNISYFIDSSEISTDYASEIIEQIIILVLAFYSQKLKLS